MSKGVKTTYIIPVLLLLFSPLLVVCGIGNESEGVEPRKIADMLHQVLQANRTVYAKYVVNRLTREEKILDTSEHWVDEKTLPLPAQMFELSSELSGHDTGFDYDLLSLWAINPANFPKTEKEREGLIYVLKNPGKNYYSTISVDGKKYFLAVYPDKAISPACVECHNANAKSPKQDFQTGDLMGGIVIRIAI
jgi:hypothetical protein